MNSILRNLVFALVAAGTVAFFPTVAFADDDDTSAPNESATEERDGASTLFSGRAVGGWGGFSVRGADIAGHGAVLNGGYGGVLLDHQLTLGLAGVGITSGPRLAERIDNPALEDHRIEGGYGGLFVQYELLPQSVIHPFANVVIGAGGVAVTDLREEGHGDWSDDDDDLEPGAFFVAEPSVGGTVNVLRWFRVDVFASYRYVRGLEMKLVDDSDLRGWSAGLAFRFGRF